jgi:scyllo-inositol 2-dehydrogenase (NADP+)
VPYRGHVIRVALIGFGAAGAVLHAPLISATAGLELAIIVTANPARRAMAQVAYPHAELLADVEDLWRRDLGLVVIATRNGAHASLAERAIEASIPVVVEKPLATSADAAARLISLAERLRVPLTVFHNRRWDSDLRTLEHVLAGGRVGRPQRLEARFELYRPLDPGAWQESDDPAEGGGVLLDLGSHRIDQSIRLFGEPSGVWSELRRLRPGATVEDDAFLSLAFPAGVAAHLWLSRAVRASGPSFRLVGSEAVFEIDGTDPQWDALARGHRPGGVGWGRHPSMGILTGGDGSTEIIERVRPTPGDYREFYRRLRAALAGAGPLPVDARDALLVLRVIEAARLSAAVGRRVSLVDHAGEDAGLEPGTH